MPGQNGGGRGLRLGVDHHHLLLVFFKKNMPHIFLLFYVESEHVSTNLDQGPVHPPHELLVVVYVRVNRVPEKTKKSRMLSVTYL